MRVKHSLEMRCICPHDGLPDRYDVTIECHRVIKVEDIVALANEASTVSMYQEDLAQWVGRRLAARVTIVGTHCDGVETTVIAE